MKRKRSRTLTYAAALLAAALAACSYMKPMPRVRPGSDMALPPDPSLVGALVGLASPQQCAGGDAGPVQVRNGDPVRCVSPKVDTIKTSAPAVLVKKP